MKKIVSSILFAIFVACLAAACGGEAGGPDNKPVIEPVDTTGQGDPIVPPVDTLPAPVDTIPAPVDTIPAPADTIPAPVDTIPEPPVVEPQIDTVVLRIMDYNVGRFNKNGGSFDVTAPKVAQIVDANRADIICMQELDSLHSTSRFQLNDFKRITPPNSEGNVGSYWKIFFGSNITYAKGSYGVGIMWKNSLGKPVTQFHTRLAKEDGLEVRGVATVEFEHFVIMCAHLDNQSTTARQHQMETACNLAVSRYQSSGKLVVLTGDFNGVINGGVDIIARKSFTRVSSDDPTAPASSPKNNPDMMYVLNNGVKYKVNSAETLKKSTMCGYGPAEVSDHRPILVELEFYVKR